MIAIKTERKIENLFLSILIIFSVLGVILFINLVHESMHKFDVRDINKSQEYMCLLNFPFNLTFKHFLTGDAAYYNISYNKKDNSLVKEKWKYTELKAYFVSWTIAIIYIVSFYGFLIFKKNK